MEDSFGLEDEDVPIVEAVTGTCRLGNVFGIEILTDEWISEDTEVVGVLQRHRRLRQHHRDDHDGRLPKYD